MTPFETKGWTKDTKLRLTRDAFLAVVGDDPRAYPDTGGGTIEAIRARHNAGLEQPYFKLRQDDGTENPFLTMYYPDTDEVLKHVCVMSIHILEPLGESEQALREQYSEIIKKAMRVRESSVYEGWVRNTRLSKKSRTIEGDLVDIIDFLLGE